MTLELKQYKSKPYCLNGIKTIANDTAYGAGVFAVTISDTRAFITAAFEYVKDADSKKYFVKNGKWVGDND